jgi:hypothetical protein
MIAVATPKTVSIIGSFGVTLVFTLGYDHVRDGVNDWFVISYNFIYMAYKFLI